MRTARATFKFLLFLLAVLAVMPAQTIVLLLTKGRISYVLPRLWHKFICCIFSIRIEIRGKPRLDTQTLFMSNHVSYLDIPALGSLLPASFVAKQEVEGWPLFGLLARLQQTAFIERRRTAIAGAKSDIASFIADGRSLIVFPEGTSTSGITVKPFKSSLFSLAQVPGRPMQLQPVTVAIAEVDGKMPQSKEDNDIYAWPLEMETPLHIHLWQFARTSGARLVITFHEPLPADEHSDRKILAKACHDSVSKGLEAAPAALKSEGA